jgi:hypothetical protein
VVDHRGPAGSRRPAGGHVAALRSRGLTALPVTYIGKAATFALMSAFPLILLGQFDAMWSRVVGALGWGFLIWGIYMYLWSFVLYVLQVTKVLRELPRVTEPGPVGSRAFGGHHPDAGLRAEQADQVTKLPVPSLLRSLLTDHLDPGYAAAAERTRNRHGRLGSHKGYGRLPGRC